MNPAAPVVFTFLLGHDFSMMSLASAIEPLRSYNRLFGTKAYAWHLLSLDGGPVEAANGIEFPTQPMADWLGRSDYLFVCGGERIAQRNERRYVAALRQAARSGIPIGSLSTGTFVLARAGLLNGYRCTIHWESRSAFRETYPDIECTRKIYEIDRSRLTCSGGTAAMDMMLNLIGERHGAERAAAIANQFHHERIRSAADDQRGGDSDSGYLPPTLRAAVKAMQEAIEEPLPLPEIAAAAGIGARQMERLFTRHLSSTPQRYYMELRLERAREMLIYTDQSIIEVAVSVGFTSTSSFAAWFRRTFAILPSDIRRSRRLKDTR
ncbi:GlxA family transcriptional regulator [Pseudomonas typographi]|uniref:GlxA family transcriptional regulator n=1 Tax=Pseudomonas typographi TaxID=2715964 RepID=UPI0016885563|nr:GlxA family transcriptional regulator [Pseudomonas typographi]MBD1552730.1 GlxA family transcriptional regulator [Pseudomonas typographi]MBD1588211.1 GlxA family transcriptional regulator [Pseudomonas typographi]